MPERDNTTVILGQHLTVSDSLARAFRGAGIQFLFGLDDPQATWHAVRRTEGIETVVIHDERSGAFMADGYTRASGRVSVCGAISGPGATNLATGLLEARRAHVPLIGLVGEAEAQLPGREPFQSAAHEAILRPLVKDVVRLTTTTGAVAAVERAITIATSGCPGPVLLLAGDDFLWEEVDESAPRDAPSMVKATVPAVRSAGAPEIVESAWHALRSARRPVIVAGYGVHLSGATEVLERFARESQIPVATTLLGKGALPDHHPLALGVATAYNGSERGRGAVPNRLLAEADAVFVIGSDLDSITTSGDAWPTRTCQLVRVDIDPQELTSRSGIGVLGDAREVLSQLIELGTMPRDDSYLGWLNQVKQARAEADRVISAFDAQVREPGYVWPGALIAELTANLSDDDAVVTDASYASAWVLDRLRQRSAKQQVFSPRGSGVLGWGLPAAIGVALARPGGRTTAVAGDGGLLYSLGELETAARLGLSLTLIVLNNRSFGYQRQADMLWQGQDDMPDLRFGEKLDWARLAEAFGWTGYSACESDEFRSIYREAGAAGGLALIDVAVDPDARPAITKLHVADAAPNATLSGVA